MLCSRCYGRRMIFLEGVPRPCPECGGFGDVHCCDGLQETANSSPDQSVQSVCDERSTPLNPRPGTSFRDREQP